VVIQDDVLRERVERLEALLRETLETEHFIICFGLRDSPNGRGIAREGVTRRGQIRQYAHALELAFAHLEAAPLALPLPPFASDGKLHVYVHDVPRSYGFTQFVPGDPPVIELACRGAEPTPEQARHRSYAAAAHELTHAFTLPLRLPTWVEKPDGSHASIDIWQWLHEGTAMFAETLVFPCNHDCMRYLVGWCDEPHRSLDHWNAQYQAGVFIGFLVRRFGHDFLGELWSLASQHPSPTALLEAVLSSRGRAFASPDPNVTDVFACGYCGDAYFLSDPSSGCFHPGLLERHGGRLITHALVPEPSHPETTGVDRVDHLGCRYYQLFPSAAASALEVTLFCDPPEAVVLRGELLPVGTQFARLPGGAVSLQRVPAAQPDGRSALRAVFPGFSTANGLDHVVLVVANCSYGATARDRVGLQLTAQLV